MPALAGPAAWLPSGLGLGRSSLGDLEASQKLIRHANDSASHHFAEVKRAMKEVIEARKQLEADLEPVRRSLTPICEGYVKQRERLLVGRDGRPALKDMFADRTNMKNVSSSTEPKMDTLICNMETLSQLVADQSVDMGTIEEACKVSIDRCAALADQMTLLSREYSTCHQELQASVSSSLNALDYRMGIMEDQTCKLVLLDFPRRMLAGDLKIIGNSCISTFAPARAAAKIIVHGFDMSKKVTLHFETALEASTFLDNFNRTNGSWNVADPLHPGAQFTLRLRRGLDFQGRQLFLSFGRVRCYLTDLMRNRGCEVGSSGLGGCVYILRGPHDPVPAVNISVSDSGAVETEIVRDALLELGISQHAAALEEAAQASAVALRDYWRGVFKAPSVDAALWHEINPFIQLSTGLSSQELDLSWRRQPSAEAGAGPSTSLSDTRSAGSSPCARPNKVQLDQLQNAAASSSRDPQKDFYLAVDDMDTHGHGGERPLSAASAAASGFINFMLMFGLCCAYGLIMFDGETAMMHQALGVKMNLCTAAFVGLLVATFSRIPVAIAGPDLNPVVFLGYFVKAMSSEIGKSLGMSYPGVDSACGRRLEEGGSSSCTSGKPTFCGGHDGNTAEQCDAYQQQLATTTIFAVAISSSLLGLAFFLIGRFKLARYASFVPTAISEAFLSCVGYKVFLYALKYSNNDPKQFIPAACLGVLLFFVKGIYDGSDVKLQYINWKAWASTVPDLLTMLVVVLMDSMLKVKNTENKMPIVPQADYEVQLFGGCNALMAACGAPVGYMQLKFNVINYGIIGNTKDRRSGVVYAMLCAVTFFWTIEPFNYMPRWFLSTLLFFAGAGFVAENLWGSRKFLSHAEWLEILFIVVVFIATDALIYAVVAGCFITAVSFISKYAKVPCIAGPPASGGEIVSYERRGPLVQLGMQHIADSWFMVVRLKGFVFFASAKSVVAEVMARLDTVCRPALPGYQRMRWVVFDCERLDGMDASASAVFRKLVVDAQSWGATCLWTKVGEATKSALGFRGILADHKNLFGGLDHAVHYIEKCILQYRQEQLDTWLRVHPGLALSYEHTCTLDSFEPFRQVFETDAEREGFPWRYCSKISIERFKTVLWEPGIEDACLFLVHSGKVAVYRELPDENEDISGDLVMPMAVYGHGWFLNREFLTHAPPRMHAVAIEDGEALCWSQAQWVKMSRERPLMAAAIVKAAMRQQSRDLDYSSHAASFVLADGQLAPPALDGAALGTQPMRFWQCRSQGREDHPDPHTWRLLNGPRRLPNSPAQIACPWGASTERLCLSGFF
ncbi:unnamed protein product [Prorocentrum cordatum]|uniref:STAS domain-containing protein n=1 Tax=Prorocentrum cordatum TaxID=2364126 RepID=A0ABN9S511_9DINO|nr:unnamed protein product [Polarella glacialis]